MPSLTIKARTTVTRDQFLKALTDFGPNRGEVWSNSQSSHLIVHELGENMAEVTEGSKIFGGAWERLRYDWSKPRIIELTTISSNIWARGSNWRYVFDETEGGQGTLITAKVTRYPNSKKGYFILIVFGSIGQPVIKRGFRKTLQAIEKQNEQQPN